MKHKRAFTLLELLVSMVIGTVILLTAATMLGEAGSSYAHITRGIHSEREVRAAFTRLSSDLHTAVSKSGTPLLKSDREIGFLTSLPGSAQVREKRAGDLCAVSYQLKDFESDGRIVRCLVRTVHESAETYQAIKSDKLADLLTTNDPDDMEPLAIGVSGIRFMPKIRNVDGSLSDWPKPTKPKPDLVEIELKLANPEEWKRWESAEDWNKAAEAGNTKGITRRIFIQYGHESSIR